MKNKTVKIETMENGFVVVGFGKYGDEKSKRVATTLSQMMIDFSGHLTPSEADEATEAEKLEYAKNMVVASRALENFFRDQVTELFNKQLVEKDPTIAPVASTSTQDSECPFN